MALTRKDLLTRGGAAVAGAGALAACGSKEKRTATRFDPADWGSVRAQFEPDAAARNFAGFLLAAHPRSVREAIAAHRNGLDHGAARYLHANEERLDADVAATVSGHLGVSAEEVALTDSTTMGLGIVYGGLRLRGGEEVVTSEHDFYATHEALRLRGVPVRPVRLYDDPAQASAEHIVRAVESALSARTRIVALTWVHSSTGVKLPVRAIADMLRVRNRGRRRPALLVLDAVHGFGAEPARMEELGCDGFVSGAHKWLAGPRGTGLAWATPELWSMVQPVIPTFDGAAYGAWLEGRAPSGVAPGPFHTPGGFHSFEHRWALADALKFQEAIGQDRIAERVRGLATRLKEGLAGAPKVRLVTPHSPSLSAGLVCLDIDGLDSGSAADRLEDDHKIVASVTPYAQRYLRLGTGIHLTEDEVDAAVEAVRAI